jgi:NDP-sugar pyrophosphorylase family protein
MRRVGVVLAAGLGQRMWPLTAHRPKPLLPVLDRPLIGHAIDRLVRAGVQEVFVNLHHAAPQLQTYLGREHWPVPVTARVEPDLTGPAGALRAFAAELAEFDVVVVSSGDVMIGDDLSGLVDAHVGASADLTFGAVVRTGARRFGVLQVNAAGDVLRSVEKPDVPDHEEHLVSAGVYCLSRAALAAVHPTAVQDYARDLAPTLIAEGARVRVHRLTGYWRDIGSPQALRAVNLDAAAGVVAAIDAARADHIHVGPGCQIDAGAVIRGPAVLGAGTVVGPGAWVEGSVVLAGSRVPPGSVLIGGLVDAANTSADGPATERPRPYHDVARRTP